MAKMFNFLMTPSKFLVQLYTKLTFLEYSGGIWESTVREECDSLEMVQAVLPVGHAVLEVLYR